MNANLYQSLSILMTSRGAILVGWCAIVVALNCSAARAQDWQEMLSSADSLRKAAQYDEAVSIAAQALLITEREFGALDTSVARALHILGDCHRRLGEYETALSYLERSLTIRERALGPDDPLVARTLNSLALLAENRGELDHAEAMHRRALESRERLLGSDHPDVAQSLNNLGNLLVGEGREGEAERLYLRALAINEAALGDEDVTVALGLNNLSAIYANQGRYAKAKDCLTRSLLIREKTLGPEHPEIALSLLNLAVLLEDLGDYVNAEELAERALRILEASLGEDHPDVAACANDLAGLYMHVGRFSDAEPLFRRAVSILEQDSVASGVELATTISNLATVCGSVNRSAEAEALYLRAIGLYTTLSGVSDYDVAAAYNNLAILYWNQSRYDEAEPLCQKAIEIWQETRGEDHPDVADGLDDLGAMYLEQGRLSEAEPLLHRALSIRERGLGQSHPYVAESLSSLALLDLQMGRHHDAVTAEMRAWTIRHANFQDGFAVLSERNALAFSQFLERETSNYLSVLLSVPSGAVQSKLSIAQAVFGGKGCVSEGMLWRNRSWTADSDEAVSGMSDSLRTVRFALSQLYVEGPGEDIDEYHTAVDSLARAKERLETELSRHSADYFSHQLAGLSEVMSALPPDASLVEFMRYEHQVSVQQSEARYIAMVIRPGGGLDVFPLGKASDIDTAIHWYRAHFEHPLKGSAEEYQRVSEGVYAAVWRPFAALLEPSELVFVAPDANLSLVSFASLIDDSGKFLIEKYPIHYLSTGRDLVLLQNVRESGSGLLAMGDPDFDLTPARIGTKMGMDSYASMSSWTLRSGCEALNTLHVSRLPGTRREVQSVVSVWKENCSEPVIVLLDTAATEEHFKQYAPGSRVVHMATHGYHLSDRCRPRQTSTHGSNSIDLVTGENPFLLSGLLLAGSNDHSPRSGDKPREDGILTAEEISGLNLTGVDLVILSACETGLGQVISGQDVYGLRRAFQMAGAATVVSSLWPIDDKASVEFVRAVFSTQSLDLARSMQRAAVSRINDLRSRNKPVDPFLWAAFVATGDWRQVLRP